MAIASLSLSFLAFIVPLGIASVVMGHISRAQIAKSSGRQTGTGLAFAGLVISYLQFAVVALFSFTLIAQWHRINHELDHSHFARAALVEQMTYGGRPSAADVAKQRQHAIDALRLIHASETDYLAAHPEEGYTCQFPQLGWDASTPNELNLHMVRSHYEIKAYQCRGIDSQQYAVVAIPRSDSNPPDSPVYCVDQTGVIRKSDPNIVNDLTRILIDEHGSCPQSGEVVEQ